MLNRQQPRFRSLSRLFVIAASLLLGACASLPPNDGRQTSYALVDTSPRVIAARKPALT